MSMCYGFYAVKLLAASYLHCANCRPIPNHFVLHYPTRGPHAVHSKFRAPSLGLACSISGLLVDNLPYFDDLTFDILIHGLHCHFILSVLRARRFPYPLTAW